MAHDFLSDEWLDAVEALRDEAPEPPAAVKDLVINMVATDSPWGDREAHMHAGTIQRGLKDDAPTTISVPYATALSMFVKGDQQAAMQAFMSGQIKVTGDMSKIMQMQAAGGPTPEQEAFQQKIRDLTKLD